MMNEVLHANIFFIIASVATVVFAIIVCFILYHLLKIIKLVRSILERVESASEMVAEDISDLRQSIKSGGVFARMMSFIIGAVSGTSRRPRSKD